MVVELLIRRVGIMVRVNGVRAGDFTVVIG